MDYIFVMTKTKSTRSKNMEKKHNPRMNNETEIPKTVDLIYRRSRKFGNNFLLTSVPALEEC